MMPHPTLTNPTLSNPINRRLSIAPDPQSYEEFLTLLFEDLDTIIRRLSMSKDKYSQGLKDNPKQGENLINTVIVDGLYYQGWRSEHDTHVNGNADLVVGVELNDKFQWLGEGKIRSGQANLKGGLKQLIHRYSTGISNQNSGGMLIYVNHTNLTQLEIMNNWKEEINNSNDGDSNENTLSKAIRFESCDDNQLAFYSYHIHPSSGLEYKVKHMIIDFRYNPID